MIAQPSATYTILPTQSKTKRSRGECCGRGLLLVVTAIFALTLCSHERHVTAVLLPLQRWRTLAGGPSNGRQAHSSTGLASSAVHCFLLLDSTGSMGNIREQTIKGLNSYISEQQGNNGTMKLTLIHFNQCNPFDVRIEAKDVREVEPLTPSDYKTSCGTPLYDAMAHTIDHATTVAIGEKDVILVVMTDGGENASREHTRDSVFRKVERMKAERGWTFVFLGANQDSFAAGQAIGVARKATANWEASETGVALAYSKISAAMTRSRSVRSRMDSSTPSQARAAAFEI